MRLFTDRQIFCCFAQKVPLGLSLSVLLLVIAGERTLMAQDIDGTIDLSFSPIVTSTPLVASTIESVASTPDGKFVIVGNFNEVSGSSANGVARLNADGSLSAVLSGCPSNQIGKVIVQADGKILISGTFTSCGAASRGGIARLDTNGDLDSSFATGAGANGQVNDMILDASGRIIIVGNFTSYDGVARPGVARLNPTTGALDTTFDPEANPSSSNPYQAVASDVDKIVVGSNALVGRYDEGGDFEFIQDSSISLGAGVTSLATVNGSIYVGGLILANGTLEYVVRLTNNGSLDPNFDSDLTYSDGSLFHAYSLLPQSDGKLLVGGDFVYSGVNPRSRIARLETDGGIDTSFDPGLGFTSPTTARVLGVLVQGDGKLVAVGTFNDYNSTARNSILRITKKAIVTGRVTSPTGQGVRNVIVKRYTSDETFIDQATTSSFGIFTFSNVVPGATYIFAPQENSRYRWAARFEYIDGDTTLADFIGLE